MSHKSALQQIAGIRRIEQDNPEDLFNECQRIAREALADTGTGEVKKQAQDRKKAERDISVLERVVSDPASVRSLVHPVYDTLPDSFMPAVEAELARMRAAVSDPEKLRMIYRRGEARRQS
jgi:hypothetical protein